MTVSPHHCTEWLNPTPAFQPSSELTSQQFLTQVTRIVPESSSSAGSVPLSSASLTIKQSHGQFPPFSNQPLNLELLTAQSSAFLVSLILYFISSRSNSSPWLWAPLTGPRLQSFYFAHWLLFHAPGHHTQLPASDTSICVSHRHVQFKHVTRHIYSYCCTCHLCKQYLRLPSYSCLRL